MLNDKCQLGVWTKNTSKDLEAAKTHLRTGFFNMEHAFSVKFGSLEWTTHDIGDLAGFPPNSITLLGTAKVLGTPS